MGRIENIVVSHGKTLFLHHARHRGSRPATEIDAAHARPQAGGEGIHQAGEKAPVRGIRRIVAMEIITPFLLTGRKMPGAWHENQGTGGAAVIFPLAVAVEKTGATRHAQGALAMTVIRVSQRR